jgi:hypothetical protein
MAERNEPSETERLLAEVDGMLGDRPQRRSVQPHGAAAPRPGWLVSRLRAAVVGGAVAGVGVWVLFALLPFLRATSGGVGAFLAAFVAVLLLRRAR